MCSKGAERKLKRLREEEAQASTAVALQAYGRPMEMMKEFKYPGRVLTTYDYEWPEVFFNLRKALSRWEHLSSIFGKKE